VEVSQENGEELGFDWIATPFGVGSNYFLGGGTVGSGTARNNTDFIGTVDRVNIPGIPASPQENVSNIVTSSLRSGSAAVNRNSIDAILNNPTRTAQANSVAPGILSMTGLFSSGQVQMIMRGLAQKKGADIMTVLSGVALPVLIFLSVFFRFFFGDVAIICRVWKRKLGGCSLLNKACVHAPQSPCQR